MELRHLRYFCGVAESRSFSRAAAKLHIAQPSLSRQVRDLESEIGVELLLRSSTGVRLTDAGEVFYQHASKLLTQLALGVSAAQEIGKGRGGEFVVGGDWRLPLDVVPHTVREIRKRFPKVDVRLLDLPMHEQIMALRERRIHIGLVPDLYVGSGDDFEGKPILRSEMVVVVSSEHRLAGRGKVTLEDLRSECFLMPDEKDMPGVRASYLQIFRLSQITPKFRTSSSTVPGLLASVCTGDGVALLPRTCIPAKMTGVVVLECNIEPFDLFAIWPKEGASPLVQPFLEELLLQIKASVAK